MANYCCNSSDYMRYRNTGRQTRYPSPESLSSGCQTAAPSVSAGCHAGNSNQCTSNDMVIAMAYVPWQEWQKLYDADKGFKRGTIFCELDKPFCGMGGCMR